MCVQTSILLQIIAHPHIMFGSHLSKHDINYAAWVYQQNSHLKKELCKSVSFGVHHEQQCDMSISSRQ